jgi:hypothetical protein
MRSLQWLFVLLTLLHVLTIQSQISYAQTVVPIALGGVPTYVEFNNSNQVAYFSVPADPTLGSLHIRATPIWGADWVHVYINPVEIGLPGPGNSTWFWEAGYNGEIITVSNTSSLWSKSNTFYIGLWFDGQNYLGGVDSGVDLSAFHHNSSCYIHHFVPVQGRTHQNHYSYYVVNTTLYGNETHTNTTVMLTKLSGQSNATQLLYSFTNQYPTLGDPSTFVATDYITGSYFFVVPNTAAESYVYVGVYGNENSTYTIVPTDYFSDENVSFTGHLKDGVPQFGVVGRSVAYYHFQPKHLNETTLITLNTLTNNIVDAYITTSDSGFFPAANQSIWNTTFEGANTIAFIPGDDARACQNYSCYYILAVVLRPGYTEFAEYHVTVTQRQRITYLQNGIIATGDVRGGLENYTYFVVPVDTVNHSVRFEIVPLTTTDSYYSVQAYISTTAAYPNNTYYNYSFFGSLSYNGYIRLTPDLACTPTLENTCYYWIAVESEANCSFEISYQVREPITLRSGLYMLDTFDNETHAVDIYRYNVNPGYGHLSYSVSDMYGNTNLYISNSAVIPDPTNSSTYQIFIPYTTVDKFIRIEEYDNFTSCTFTNSSTSFIPHCTYTFRIETVSQYSVVDMVVSELNSTTILIDNVPIRTIGKFNAPDYYLFINPNSSRDIVFEVQSAAYVYLSNTTSHPDGSHFMYQFGDMLGVEKYVIPSEGFWYISVVPFDGTEYTILAFTVDHNNTNDTTVVHQLQAGVPLFEEYLPANYTHYYEFFIPNNTYVVFVEVNAGVGAPTLSCNWGPFNTSIPYPTSSSAMAVGYDFHFNSIYVSNPMAGRYLCAVYANFTNSASYSISYNAYGNITVPTTLSDGQVVSGFSEPTFPRYYQIQMPLNFSGNISYPVSPFEFRVSLTGYSGTAMLFVSTSPYPGPNSYMWRSTDAGTTAVHVSPDDPNWCNISISGQPCVYYITVLPLTNSFYRLVATTTRFGSPVFVHNQITINAINSHISSVKYVYHPLNYEIGRDIRMATSPSYGAAHIYVNVINVTDVSKLNVTGLFPTPENYTFVSYGDYAGSFLHIHANDSRYCNLVNTNDTGAGERSLCVYLVTVAPIDPFQAALLANATVDEIVNATIPSQFTFYIESVVVDAALDTMRPRYYDGVHHIIDHVPVWRSLEANSVHYYKFMDVTPGQDIFATFTPIMGVGEMFVSYAPFMYPTNTTSVFSSILNNTHTFNTIGAMVTPYNNATILYVAVRAYTNLTYTIVGGQSATNNSALSVYSPTRLTDGVPQYDTISDVYPNAWRFYDFYLPVNDSLHITFPRRMGDVEVYVKFQPFSQNGSFVTSPPTAMNNDFSMTHHGLDAHKFPYAQAGRYLIAVFAKWRTDYAICVTAGATASILFFDQPMTARLTIPSIAPQNTPLYNVSGNFYVVPLVAVSEYRDLFVDVTIMSGIATVFISEQPYIDPFNSSTYFQNYTHDRLDNMLIPNAMLRQGPYFILVVSSINTTYSIVATYKEYQQLQMGLPSNGYAVANDTHYFHLTLSGYPHDAVVLLQPEHGKGHVFANDVTNTWNVPNPFDNTSYAYSSTDPFNAAQHMLISNSQCNSSRCTYLIAVHALHYSDLRYNIYVMPANTTEFNNATILLQGTVPQLGFTQHTNDSVKAVGFTHYEFHVPSNQSGVSITLSPYTYGGWVQMAIGRTTFPQVLFNGINQSYTILYADWIQDNRSVSLYFDYTDPKLVGTDMSGTYYVTVFSVSDVTGSAYTIALNVYDNFTSGTNHSSMYLIDGAMQWGHLPNMSDVYHLYELWVPFVNLTNVPDFHRRPTSFTLTSPTNAGVQMFVNWDGTIPTPDHHAAHTNGSYNDAIVLPPLDACDNTVGDCRYLITVYNFNPTPNGSIYYITGASEMGGLTAIWPGIEQFGFVYNGFPAYFVFNKMLQDAREFKVGLTSLGDIPIDAFISFEDFPTPDNYTFRTHNEFGVITGRIPNAVAGPWVIGIYPPFGIFNSSTAFRLTVSSEAVLLTNVPYGDVLYAGQQSLYVVDLTSNPNPTSALTVQLNPMVDVTAVNMYIAKADVNNLPGPNNHILMVTPDSANPNVLLLNSDVPNYNPNGVYFVVVESVSANASYTITATLSVEPFVIEDGKDIAAPYPLQPTQTAVYRYNAFPSADFPLDLMVSVEKLYGALTLCVGYEVPNPTNFTANTTCISMLDFEPGRFIIVPKEQVLFGAYYISLTVVGDVPAYYILMASMAIPQLNSGIPIPGRCDPASYPPAYYLNIGAADRITFDITPIEQPNVTIPNFLDIYISNNRSNRFPGPSNATWAGKVSFGIPFAISRVDANLGQCVTNPTASCTLFIVLGGCNVVTDYIFSATLGSTLVELSSDDFRTGAVAVTDYDYYAINVAPNFPIAHVDIEQCYGLTHAFISTSVKFPNMTVNQGSATNDTSLNHFDLSSSTANTTRTYYISVLGTSLVSGIPGDLTLYRVITRSFNVPALNLPARAKLTQQKTTESQTVSFSFPLVVDTTSNYSYIYTVYADDRDDPNFIYFTHCGLELISVHRTYTQEELQAQATDNVVTLTIGDLDDSKKYNFIVYVQAFANVTYFGGSAIYQPLLNILPVPKHGSGTHGYVIALAVIIPIAVILLAVAFYFYSRNRKLKQELTVELPDVATSRPGQFKKRAVRGSNVGSSSFSRNNDNYQTSLLDDNDDPVI